MPIKIVADNVACVSNPKRLLVGNSVGCSFIIGGTNHPVYAFTTMDKINSLAFVVCWGNVAETAIKYFQKGSIIDVYGTLTQREWHRDDGKAIFTEVRAHQVRMVRPSNSADLMQLSPMVEEILAAWDQADAVGDPDNAMLRSASPEDDKAPTPPRREDEGRRCVIG